MSSDSSTMSETKVCKLRSRKYFPIWKQKILSAASSKGYDKYLTTSVAVKTDAEIDAKEVDYINEADDKQRRIKKGELHKMKSERKKSLAAAEMLTNSVRSKDLKMLANCKLDPKKMFDKICKRYGSEEDTDLSDLLDDFNDCVLKSKRKDPEDWYAELDQINEQLEGIDAAFAKSEKEIAAHILSSLPKGYKAVKTIIQMDDNHLDDVSKLKKHIVKHWKANFRKKARKSKNQSSSDDESSSSSEESRKERRTRKKKGDELALNVEGTKTDSRSPNGVIICGNCGKMGHGIANCWDIHGRPSRTGDRRTTTYNGDRAQRRCWVCGSSEHLAFGCPNKNNGGKSEGNEDEQINNLFVGMVKHFTWKMKGARMKCRYGACETIGPKHTKEKCLCRKETNGFESENESWANVEHGDDPSMSCKSHSSNDDSWCQICNEEGNTSDHSGTRQLRKELELKTILGIASQEDYEMKNADMMDFFVEGDVNDDGSDNTSNLDDATESDV